MPTINNATVATGTGLSTAGNGGRKLVRLSNGWLVSVVKTTVSNFVYYKSSDNGSTWSLLYNGSTQSNIQDIGLVPAKDGAFYTLYSANSTVSFAKINSDGTFSNVVLVDSSQTALGNVSLAINDAGTELHAAWSSKNSTYPNVFNIRYAKGTIVADGSVTWGAVEQVTFYTSTSQTSFAANPSVCLDINQKAMIFCHQEGLAYFNGSLSANARSIFLLKRDLTLPVRDLSYMNSSWSGKEVFSVNSGGLAQLNVASLYTPQSINGLANGRLWVAWHGKDATDSAKFNIRTSFSDDGGVTWATPTKQTTGNTYDQMNASLTADSQGKVLLTWDAQNATTTQTALKVFNGTWGATTTLTGEGYTNVSTLLDNTFKLSMTTPPLIRQSTSGVYFSGTYFTGASVSPASGALGDKTASSVLSYTVTPESGSTITSIVEKVNGTTVNTYSNPASLSRTFTIPLANWDALKYYNTHTISVTVTDSNGMANTQVYSFNKALANDASLLEGAKAAKDGKDRISTKRDVLAGQVGLPPGSTFDAISAQLASGNAVVKRQTGTATSTTATIGGYNYVTIPFSAIGFVPKSISIQRASNTAFLTHCNVDSYFFSATKYYSFTNNFGELLDGTSWYVNESGVQLAIGASLSNVAVKWIAYG